MYGLPFIFGNRIGREGPDKMQMLSKSVGGKHHRLRPMRAFAVKGAGKAGLTDKAIPAAGPDDVIVRTTAALLCPHDTRLLNEGGERHQNLTLGHEAVGIVYETGSNVRSLRKGQRVVACAPGPPAESPAAIHDGRTPPLLRDGVLAEYFVVERGEENLAVVPVSVTDEAAVYCSEILPYAMSAAENARVPLGGTAAVFGEGAVGLMATAGLRLLGAGQVIGIESVPEKQELALRFGADALINSSLEAPAGRLLEITMGRGADSAICTVSSEHSFSDCLAATSPGGFVSCALFHSETEPGPLPAPVPSCMWDGKTVVSGSFVNSRTTMERMLRLIASGRVDPSPLTTHRFTFDMVEGAFDLLSRNLEGVIRILISFP